MGQPLSYERSLVSLKKNEKEKEKERISGHVISQKQKSVGPTSVDDNLQ